MMKALPIRLPRLVRTRPIASNIGDGVPRSTHPWAGITNEFHMLEKKQFSEKGSTVDRPIYDMNRNNVKQSLRAAAIALGWTTVLNMGANCAAPPPPPPQQQPIPADNAARETFASQCAQNVITCTTSFPVAILDVHAGQGQVVTQTIDGFRVEGSDGDGVERVQFIGGGSLMVESTEGNNASMIFYEWSYGATDEDLCTLTPGTTFSHDANPLALLQVGIHYIRLHVSNDLTYGQESLLLEECGQIGQNNPKADFEEVRVEVID